MERNIYKIGNELFITSDEEIKEGDWFITTDTNEIYKSDWIKFCFNNAKKIILTTDDQLIKDGVQAIDDDFLEWFVKNSSCENVLVTNLYGDFNPIEYFYEIIIPKEEPKQERKDCYCKELTFDLMTGTCRTCGDSIIHLGKRISTADKQETLEEVALRVLPDSKRFTNRDRFNFVEGIKWQQEQDKNKYSEEEVLGFGKFCLNKVADFLNGKSDEEDGKEYSIEELFEQFKKK